MFDVHLHLSDEVTDVPAFFADARSAGVHRFLLAGTSLKDCPGYVALSESEPGVYACVGVHPHDSEGYVPEMAAQFRDWLKGERVVAVGEIGLDFFYDFAPVERQKEVFVEFLKLSNEVSKPVVIHCREAFDVCYPLVKEFYDLSRPFLIHSFTGSLEEQARWLELGAYISYNGMVTFKKADNVRAALAEMPLDRLLLETDSPYLAPVPKRGTPNSPANLPLTASRIAQERGLAENDLVSITTENALRLFNIPRQ